MQPFQKRIKFFPVLGSVDVCQLCAQNREPGRLHVFGQLDGRLPAKLHHHAVGLLHIQHIEHLFGGQRLKIQPIGSVKVRRYGFRVVVDDHGVVARFFQRPDAVHRAIVKFHTLADANRPAAQYHHGFPLAFMRFVFLIIR